MRLKHVIFLMATGFILFFTICLFSIGCKKNSSASDSRELRAVDTVYNGVNLVKQGDSNTTTTTILTTAFNALDSSVDFSELSSEMGLSSTLSSSSIEFSGAILAYDANHNNPFAETLCANFKQNGVHNLNLYGFAWISDTSSFLYGQQFMVKINVGQSITLYDLTQGFEYTIKNYTNANTVSFFYTQGSYIKGLSPNSKSQPLSACTGANVMNCIADAYTNHGWASIWVTIQTAYLPATAVAIAGSCAAINCVSHTDNKK